MSKEAIKRRIERTVAKWARVRATSTTGMVPAALTDGKLYEAHVLALVLERMVKSEGMTIQLRPGEGKSGSRIVLRSKGGPISTKFPHFDLLLSGKVVAELWTDVEFVSLSYDVMGDSRPMTPGDYHELDLLIVKPKTRGRPRPEKILLGVECKNTTYGKDMLREILGVRRELSLLAGPTPTSFRDWPRRTVPANPPSCIVVFSTDQSVLNFSEPGKMFGIDFVHEDI